MPIVKMKKDEILSFFGPAAVTVLNGLIEVLSKKFGRGERIIVHKLKNYIVHAIEDTELDVSMGQGAQIQQVDENEPYLERLGIAKEIIENGYEKIMIIGGIDVGKSTLTVLLSNMALEKGYKPAVIDSDVGQADIGPPCFISMSYPEQQVLWMRELKPVAMKFIGDIKPQYHIEGIIHKLLELIGKAQNDKRKPVIIDTDGWVGDEYALNYKHRLINEVKPDALIVIGEELAVFFRKYERIGIKTYVTRTPIIRRTRNREERRMLRRDKYKEYLENAPQRKIELDNVIVIGHPLFHGVEIPKPTNNQNNVFNNILYISKTYDTLHIVTQHHIRSEQLEVVKKTYGISKIKVYPIGFEKNMYVAVSDGSEDYPALIEKIDYNNKSIILKTGFNGEIRIIKLSNIRLTEDYSEQMI